MGRKITIALTAALALGNLLSPLTATAQNHPDCSKLDMQKLYAKMSPLKESMPTQWRMTCKGDATSTATISWSTENGDGEHVLYYGSKSSKGNPKGYEQKQTCQRNGQYQEGEIVKMRKGTEGEKKYNRGFYHHARLNNLKPATKYYLTMVSNGIASDEFYFITASTNPEKLMLIHGGDSRTGIDIRCSMNVLMSRLVENHPEIYGIVHGGDYVTNGPIHGEWRGWMSHTELLTTSENRLIPIIPARGNHDDGICFSEVMDFTEKGVATDYCHEVTFGNFLTLLTLDTNDAAKGVQEKYAEEVLSRRRSKSKWLLAQYHCPMYPAVKDIPNDKKIYVPLFEKYNLDLALESDGHNMKRTVPIRNDKLDPTGVVYIGEGGLGAGQRSPKKKRWYISAKDGAFSGKGNHIMLLTMDKKSLTIETIRMDGKVPDKHTIKVRQR